MPYQMIKVKGKNLYKVINEISGKVHSKASTKENAEKQIRLMEMFYNNTRKRKIKKKKGIRPSDLLRPSSDLIKKVGGDC